MLKKSHVLLLTGICLCAVARGQDQLPSQFFASPFSLNPALIGKVEGNYRVCAQLPTFGSSLQTTSVSADIPVLSNLYDNRDGWGFGLRVREGRSANSIMSFRDLSFATAYSKGLDDRGFHQISVGFMATNSKKNISSENAAGKTKEEIVSAFSLVGSLPKSDEVLDYNYPAYWDMGSGFIYSGTSNGKDNFYFGLAGYHINFPMDSYKGKVANFIEPLLVWQGGGSFPLAGNKKSIHISALYTRQGNVSRIIAGGAFSRSFEADYSNGDRRFFFGAWARMQEEAMQLAPYLALEYNGIRLGLSLLMGSAGKLGTYSTAQRGLELTLIYIRKNKGVLYKPSPIY